MSEVALRFLLANLAAASAIVVVLLLRKPVRAAFGAQIAYALWLLAPLAAIGSVLPPRIIEVIQPALTAAPIIDLPALPPEPVPSCRIKVKDLIMPRSSQVPQPRADESLINQFGFWYDTNAPQMVRGKVERVEFSDRTFDAYIRSEARSALPSRLYQVRSEYRFPRADIERALLDKTVVASGWRARDAINTFCDPVCGLYANDFTFLDRSHLTPVGSELVTPSPYFQRPRGELFMSIADLSAPVILRAKITRYVPDPAGVNPILWVESAGDTQPDTTFGAKAGAVWVIAGFPFDAREDWVGKTAVIRGFNVEDKRCQPQCMMAGESIRLVQ
jgi:hypothetical protein